MSEQRTVIDRLDESLDVLLGRSRPASGLQAGDSRLEPLLSAAERLRGALMSDLEPEVQSRHLRMLVDRARGLRLQNKSKRRSLRSLLLRPIAALTMLGMVAGPATAAAASDSLPGDTLYGAKLATEELQLLIERDLEADAVLHLEFAERRLDEVVEIEGSGRSKGIERALANRKAHLAAAKRDIAALKKAGRDATELTETFNATSTHHQDVLSDLATKANCDASDPDAGSPQCKGLLTAIERSDRSGGPGVSGGNSENSNRPSELPDAVDRSPGGNGASKNKGRKP